MRLGGERDAQYFVGFGRRGLSCRPHHAMSLGIHTLGSGADLVLLHGWGTGAEVWDELAPALALGARVHAVNLPGYGASAPCAPYSTERIADELALHLPAQCTVCGWSLGGQVALAWAHRRPRQVSRVALIATTPSFVQRSDWPHALEAAVLRGFARALSDNRGDTLRRFVALQSLGDAHVHKVTKELRARLMNGVQPQHAILADGLALLLHTDLRAILGDVTQPALLLQGARDRLVPLAAAQSLCASLPNARLAVMKEAAHAPFISDAANTAALLKAFLHER